MPARTVFDKPYYDRFYGRDRRAYRRDEDRLGDFVFAYLDYLEQPVGRILDIGCGHGQWRDIAAKHRPGASYTGVEHSEYLCKRYGWTQGSVVDFTDRPFDLVICKDTMQYLSPRDFERSVDNLAALCAGALYVSVLTIEDYTERCDKGRTDDQVYMRTGAWYRRRLARHFTNVGGGVFLSAESEAVAWELERLPAR